MEFDEIYNEKLIKIIKEKIETLGEVQSVSYLRKETGMSLIQAKKFIDACKKWYINKKTDL